VLKSKHKTVLRIRISIKSRSDHYIDLNTWLKPTPEPVVSLCLEPLMRTPNTDTPMMEEGVRPGSALKEKFTLTAPPIKVPIILPPGKNGVTLTPTKAWGKIIKTGPIARKSWISTESG